MAQDDLSMGFNFAENDDNSLDEEIINGSAEDEGHADAESNADKIDFDEASYQPSNSQSRGASLAPGSDASNARARIRANGQSYAEQRPISADLDSTDELIVNLKDSGYANEQVCDQLLREGRINYDRKTVGSRYIRLKNAILEREEERLDGELTDWHDGEDEALLKADQLALAEIKDVVARTKAKRWHLVAKNLQKILNKESKYSAGACQKRFIALREGRAIIPPELDDQPDRRFEEKAARVLAALHDQKLRVATEKQAKEAKSLASDNAKLQKAMEKKERADKRAKVAEERARLAMAQASKREEKAKELEVARQAQADQIQILRQGKAAPTPKASSSVAQTNSPITPSSSSTSTPGISSSKKASNSQSAAMNDPRARLSLKELKVECSNRGLSQTGTKAVLILRLSTDDSAMSVAYLQDMLREHNVSTEGTKAELIVRLAHADAGASEWGKRFAKGAQTATTSSSKREASAERDEEVPKRPRLIEMNESRSNSPLSVISYLGSREQSVARVADKCDDSLALANLAADTIVNPSAYDMANSMSTANDETKMRRLISRSPNFDMENSFLSFVDDGVEETGTRFNDPDLDK